jgi:hypothetical protein
LSPEEMVDEYGRWGSTKLNRGHLGKAVVAPEPRPRLF